MIKSRFGLSALLLLLSISAAVAQPVSSYPGCVYWASPPTIADGQWGSTTCDSSGQLRTTSTTGGSISTWAGGTLGAMAAYGTSPGAVLVPGVNAFITNSPTVVDTGAAASGAAVSGNPVRIGYQARTTNLAVATTQTVDGIATTAGAHVVYMWSLPGLTWKYAAAAGGIVNSTTAVTLIAAAGGGIKNYVKHLQISVAGTVTTASELVIRDGAAGTVIWRGSLLAATTTQPIDIDFEPPLGSTAATLLEAATLTGMGAASAVYLNAQGFQGP